MQYFKRCFSSEIFKGISLIMSGTYWIYIYPILAIGYILLVLSGLGISESGQAEFFGRTIPPMRGMSPDENLRFCFCGFVNHFWWIAMMMLSFGGMKAVLSTWDQNFLNFVRFSRKSRFYLESLRWCCFSLSLIVIVSPFFFAAFLGYWQMGMSTGEAGKLLCCSISSLLLTGILIYVAGSCKLPDYYSGLFFTCPLILTGIQMFLVSRGVVDARHWFIPLVPYCYDTQTNSSETALLTSLCLLALLFTIRVWLCRKTV